MHNILIADDHPLFRDALRVILVDVFPDAVILETCDLPTTIEKANEIPDIDLILLDLNMSGMDGFNGIVKLKNTHPSIPIVVVSGESKKSIIMQAITYGAIGFITKSTDSEKIANALIDISEGKIYLPPDVIRSDDQYVESSQVGSKRHESLDPELIASLTKRQLYVFELITKGSSNKQIAYELNIAETTVKAHVSAILVKLNVTNRIQAALRSSDVDFDNLLNRVR